MYIYIYIYVYYIQYIHYITLEHVVYPVSLSDHTSTRVISDVVHAGKNVTCNGHLKYTQRYTASYCLTGTMLVTDKRVLTRPGSYYALGINSSLTPGNPCFVDLCCHVQRAPSVGVVQEHDSFVCLAYLVCWGRTGIPEGI